MKTIRLLILAALMLAPSLAFAQTQAPLMLDSTGHKQDGTVAKTQCSADSGVTWVPCSGSGGGSSGDVFPIAVAQTVTASSAYASGNAVGGLLTLANAVRSSGGSGILQSVVANSKSAQTTEIDIFFFSANPTGSTCTDKTAFVLAAADIGKVVDVVAVTSWYPGNTASIGSAPNRAIPFVPASGSTMYACAVTRSTPTYTATSDLIFTFTFFRY